MGDLVNERPKDDMVAVAGLAFVFQRGGVASQGRADGQASASPLSGLMPSQDAELKAKVLEGTVDDCVCVSQGRTGRSRKEVTIEEEGPGSPC